MQQFLLLLIIGYFIWFYKRSWPSVAAIVLTAGLLINSAFWFFHAERGQVYIIYSTWVTVLFALWHRNSKAWIILAGFWLAVGIFAFVSFLLLINKDRYWLLVSCALCIAILIPICGGLQVWQQYFAAINIYVDLTLNNLSFPPSIKPAMPASIEGATNLQLYRNDFSIIHLSSLHNYFSAHGWRPAAKVYMAIFLSLASALTLIFLLLNKNRKATPTQFFMLAILLYTLAEICQPLRVAYNLIQWLPTLLAAVGFIFGGQRKTQ